MRETIYLSPTGDDRNDGRRLRPVATLVRAVELSRSAATAGKTRRIVVADGVYYDTEAILDARDSGLELVAAPRAHPVFHGGVPIVDWRPEGGDSPFWVADVDALGESARDIRALMVDGRLAPRARFPETGALPHASEFPVQWMSTTKGGWERKPTEEELTTLALVPGSLPPTFSPDNAELTLYHCWDESLVGVKQWRRESDTLVFSTPAGHPPGAFAGWKEQARTFVVWNTREGMIRPGQWYLDRERGCLVYWPLTDKTPAESTLVAPTRRAVLRLAGSATAPVRDIRVKGLAFGVTSTPLTAGGFGALKFGGAIEGEHTRGVRLEDVVVRGSGGQGIRLLHSNRLRCRGCTLHDVGAGGVVLSGEDGVVTRTLIHHVGRIYPSSLGLRVQGKDWRVHHNTLHHTPYSAVNAGGERLRFEHNRFHHVMEELLDGAAIYIFAAKACVLRGNYTYDVRDEQVHAYYLDEQSENSLVEGNVAVGVPWPIHNHMAWNCTLRHNVCLNRGDLRVSFANCDRFTLSRNVFACDGTLVFEPSYTGVSRLVRNAFFSRAGVCRWTFHDRLPSLERNDTATAPLPRNEGSMMVDLGCRCRDGRIEFERPDLAANLGIRPLDVSQAGCGRD